MKSFSNYLNEEKNPLQAAQCLLMKQDDIEYDVLCVRSAIPNAMILVTDHEHPDYASVISTEDLDLETTKFRVHEKIKHRIPISNFLFQQRNFAPIKKVEYHDTPKKLKESLVEDLDRTSLLYYMSEYRKLKRRDDINAKLNLILEILLSSENERRTIF
jgi:hypothetical protein